MRPFTRIAAVTYLAASLPATSQVAGDSALAAALRDVRSEAGMSDCRLTLGGGRAIADAARKAQFTVIGEAHGVREVPQFAGALFCELAFTGYRHLAIEVSPPVATALEKRARMPNALAALTNFGSEYYPGAPFYMLREEAQLLERAMRATGNAPHVLWGLDYDVSTEGFASRRLLALARPDARPAVQQFVSLAESTYADALASRNPGKVFSFAGSPNRISSLRAALKPTKGSESDAILSLLENTIRINGEWLAGHAYESNVLRSENLKTSFVAHYAAARKGAALPKVMVKLGAAHAYRGRNPSNTFDVGSFIPELAAANGTSAIGIMVVAGEKSKQALFDPSTFGYSAAPNVYGGVSWMKPFYDAANADKANADKTNADKTNTGSWSVFDLRALRPSASSGRLGALPAALLQTIFGFDFLVVLNGSQPSTELDLVRPSWALRK